jgi:hypothetical protein
VEGDYLFKNKYKMITMWNNDSGGKTLFSSAHSVKDFISASSFLDYSTFIRWCAFDHLITYPTISYYSPDRSHYVSLSAFFEMSFFTPIYLLQDL